MKLGIFGGRLARAASVAIAFVSILTFPMGALAETYPAETTANGTTVVQVGIPGTYDTSHDADAIALINQYRDEANTYQWTDSNGVQHTGMAELSYGGWSGPITNRPHLTQNAGLSFAAQIRAVEASFYTDHTRPATSALNNTFGSSVVSRWGGEALAWNYGTVGGVQAWYGEKDAYVEAMKAGTSPTSTTGHYEQMIKSGLTTTSIGSFQVSNGCWTVVASDVGSGSDGIALRPTGECVQRINVKTDYLTATLSGKSTVGVGSAIKLSSTIKDSATENWLVDYSSKDCALNNLTDVSNTSWVSENTGVATVDGGGNVTGVASGNTTIDFYIGSALKASQAITVTPGIASAEVSSIPDQTYTGSEIRPVPTVTLSGTALTNGTDYTLSYGNNVNAGTATVTITGIGSYPGTKTVDFTISKAQTTTSVDSGWSTTFDGSAIAFGGTEHVTMGSTAIEDATVTYRYSDSQDGTYHDDSFTNAGTYYVQATYAGDDNHYGSTSSGVAYVISPANIDGADAFAISDVIGDGTAKTPTPEVWFNNNKLTENVDYTVSYASNTAVGTADVIISGTGNFTGTKTVHFNITEPPAPNFSFLFSTAYQGVSYSGGSYYLIGGDAVPGNMGLTWSWASTYGGGLPDGLSMDSSTGVVTGTSMSKKTYSVTVTAINQYGKSASCTTSISVEDPKPHLGWTSSFDMIEGVESSQTPYMSGLGTITYELVGGSLPSGVSWGSSTGLCFSGTPTEVGTFNPVIRATNEYGYNDLTFTLNVSDGSPEISTAYPYGGFCGVPYSALQLEAKGLTPMTWSWEAALGSELPAGLTLDPSKGTISGTPEKEGRYYVKVTATNSRGSDSKILSFPIESGAPLIGDYYSLADGYLGESYSASITSSGATPVAYALQKGSLPPGLTLSEDGTIGGTPTQVGTYSFTINATNSYGTGTRDLTLTVTDGTPAVSYVSFYSFTEGVSGGSSSCYASGLAPITWSWEAASGSTLPPGLTMSANGSVTGTPTQAGSYAVKVTATNGKGSSSKVAKLIVASAKPAIYSTYAPTGYVGASYSGHLYANGAGTMTWEWSASAGSSLPPGLELASDGSISGTPTAAGTYWVTASATNASGTDSSTTEIVIEDAKEPAFYYPSISTIAMVGSSLTRSVGVSRATSCSVTSGSLPDGLSLTSEDGSWNVAGTLTKRGTYSFTITATNAQGSASQDWTITVYGNEPSITTACSLADGNLGESYYGSLSATGGDPMRWTLVAGSLPPGLTLHDNSATYTSIDGTPTQAGTYTFTVRAQNEIAYDQKEFTITVDGGEGPSFSKSSGSAIALYGGYKGSSYYANLGVSGSSPMNVEVSSGSLPAGVSATAYGTNSIRLSGAPLSEGDYSFTLKVSNAYGAASQAYSLHVGNDPTISTTSIPAGVQGAAYTANISGTGRSDLIWSVVGTLPEGLSLSSSGYSGHSVATISGTPSSSGTYTFALQAIDDQGNVVQRSYTLSVQAAGTVAISPKTMATGSTLYYYSDTITASGESPVTLALASGSKLPDGLVFAQGASGQCTIKGVPTQAGTFSFSVVATDTAGHSAQAAYSIDVKQAKLSISTTGLSGAEVGASYSGWINYDVDNPASLSARPYPSSVRWSVISGALPSGLVLSNVTPGEGTTQHGLLSGTPTKPGTYTFTLQASDGTSTSARQFTLVVSGSAPAFNTSSLPDGALGEAYEAMLYASGSKPISWSATGLPSGLSLSSDGILSGTPSGAGEYSVAVKATNAVGSNSMTYSLLVKGDAPSMPTNASAEAGVSSVTLSWEAPSWTGTSAIQGYRIYRDGALIATVDSSARSYQDTAVTNGTLYSYGVVAYNASGNGQECDSLAARPGQIATTVTLSGDSLAPVYSGGGIRFGGSATVRDALGRVVSGASVTYLYSRSYDGTYSSNLPVTAGTWWVKGTYAGDATHTSSFSAPMSFTIGRKSISGASVSGISSSYTATGSAIAPKPTVQVESATLVAGTDYTVSYSDNVNPGTATVTIAGIGNYADAKSTTFAIVAPAVPMHRLYNPNSGEHFYTGSTSERDGLVEVGWRYEGVGWTAPASSGTPVHRLYNPNAGDHHYTMDASERDMLVGVGWTYEGVGWYSDDARAVPLYRQYNPNARAGAHNYTTSRSENDWLVSLGWRGEGIGWYGV